MRDVIASEDVCGDTLCKYLGCKMNDKRGVTVSCKFERCGKWLRTI